MKDSKYKYQSWPLYRAGRLTQWASFTFLAVTSAYFIAPIAYTQGAKVNGFIAAISGIAGAVVFFLMIDNGLGIATEYVIERWNDRKDKARKKMYYVSLTWVIFRAIVTGTVSWWAGAEIADRITADVDHSTTHATIDAVQETESQKLTIALSEAEKARQSEPKRVQAAKAKGSALVEAAINNHPNPDVPKGYRAGKEWYLTTPKLRRYRDRIERAKVDSAKLVQAEIDKTAAAVATLSKVQTNTGTETAVSGLLGLAQDAQTKQAAKESRRTYFLITADLLALLFGFLGSWVKVLYRSSTGYEDETGEKSLSLVWSEFWKDVRRGLVRRAEKLLRVDLDGNGEVGTVKGDEPQQPAQVQQRATVLPFQGRVAAQNNLPAIINSIAPVNETPRTPVNTPPLTHVNTAPKKPVNVNAPQPDNSVNNSDYSHLSREETLQLIGKKERSIRVYKSYLKNNKRDPDTCKDAIKRLTGEIADLKKHL